MNSATESSTTILRRMLDERGVKYFKHEDGEPLRKLEKADEPATSWHMGGASVCAVPIEGSDLFDLWIDHCTPEQAIAATLGTPERTCRIEERYIDWYCDACFEMVGTCDTTSELFIDGNAIKLWNYCPNCGARVERREQ